MQLFIVSLLVVGATPWASATPVVRDILSSFLPPVNNTAVTGATMSSSVVSTVDECAASCAANSSCVSFHVMPLGAVSPCGIKGECYAPNASSCPAYLTLACPGGVFTSVNFASYGTPVTEQSACNYTVGACNAASSAAVVAAACVGQSVCSIDVQIATFGDDPCPGVYKFLAVSLQGTGCGASPGGSMLCTLNSYSRIYTLVAANATYYQKLQPRNDSRYTQVVPWQLQVPTSNVSLLPGLLATAAEVNVAYLLNNFPVDDLLFNFRKRAGLPQPSGAKCIGWDCSPDWIEGSLAGLFMMGAGNYLRWNENEQLRTALNTLIDGIENCSLPDGFIMAFDEDKMATDEHPDYTLSWTAHGLIDAHIAGNTKALPLLRGMMNWFNNHSLIPTFLPPDGGNAPFQTPLGPAPPGFSPNASSGSGTETGHTIYLIYQGIIHNTQMALTELGTQADVDLVSTLYQEQWWLDFLATGNVDAVSSRQWFWHNYEVTGYEAYLDMYVLTGKQIYLDAMLNAWNLFRTYYLHVGGSAAINEGNWYAPGSYWLTAGAPSINAKRDVMRLQRMIHAHGHAHAAAHWMEFAYAPHASHDEHGEHSTHGNAAVGRALQNDWGHHPTGEMCGAVFWLKFNQRFHRLFPFNETFVGEMEKEIFNEGLTHQGAGGVGIRYFSNLNGQKELPAAIGTCCEGQGTRLLGSLAEYLYSIAPDGFFVDMYAPSVFTPTVAGVAYNLTTTTAFPYGDGSVTIDVSSSAAADFNLYLRIPAWTATGSVQVTVDGRAAASGAPGTYVTLAMSSSPTPARVAFALPAAAAAHAYTGATQIDGYSRFAFTVGPILLAFQSARPWNATLNTIAITGVDPTRPDAWLTPAGDGNSLHFNVTGTDVYALPNYEIQEDYAYFTAYPAFA